MAVVGRLRLLPGGSGPEGISSGDNRSEAEGVSERTSGVTDYPDHGGPAGGGKPPEPGRPMDVQKSNVRSDAARSLADLFVLLVEIAVCQESSGSMLAGLCA
jgi:hypothetical protein